MPHVQNLTLLHDQYPTRESYPFTMPVLQQTRRLEFNTPVTIFVGENGSGKSTLLEALAKACGVHIWEHDRNMRRVRVNEYEKLLHRFLKVSWANGNVPGSFFGAEVFRDFKLMLDEWAVADPGQLKYFGGESLVTQSHGQSMMAYFRARYQIKGVYFLDEPETGLSPASLLELLEIIEESARAGHGQFFMATHSPILLACPLATLYSFDHLPAKPIRYEETSHYRIYKRFIMDRE